MSLKKVDSDKTEKLISLKNLNEIYATYQKVRPLIDDLKELMEKLIVSNMKVELDDLIRSHSEFYDELLLKAMHTENLTFVGGQLVINANEKKDVFSFDMEAYFKDVMDEWIKKEHSVSYPLSSLISKDRQELTTSSVVKYELNAPTEKEVTP